jgi:hypothetical protein
MRFSWLLPNALWRLCVRFACASRALFVRHGFHSALTADPAALSAHVPHDLLNDGKLRGLCSFQEYPAGILDGIKFRSAACPLWHTPKRGTKPEDRQEMGISNRPTTQV